MKKQFREVGGGGGLFGVKKARNTMKKVYFLLLRDSETIVLL